MFKKNMSRSLIVQRSRVCAPEAVLLQGLPDQCFENNISAWFAHL